LEKVWREMKKICDQGLARAIGLSNANVEQIKRVKPIHVNQVECHLHLNQKDLKVNRSEIIL
jgi:diketogulonate reductase-like aldo/keto reductase